MGKRYLRTVRGTRAKLEDFKAEFERFVRENFGELIGDEIDLLDQPGGFGLLAKRLEERARQYRRAA